MEDVLALNERPYLPEEPVVFWMKSPCPCMPMCAPRPSRPGHGASQDTDYRRCGTANLFGVVEPNTGRHFTCATPDRAAAAFARMIRIIDAYPAARPIHLVVDNLNTQRSEKALTGRFGAEEGHRLWSRLTVHYTPKHGSWLNQAEIELSLVSRQRLGTRRIPDLAQLRAETRAWATRANRRKATIGWRFTRKDARRKFGYVKPLSSRS